MLKVPSLTQLELRIITFFIENSGKGFALREVSRLTKIDYKLTYITIKKLVEKEVLLKKRIANADICSLNLNNPSPQLYYAEFERLNEFVRRHTEFKSFFETLLQKNNELFCIIAVFGSLAKGTERKTSDIDILVVAPTRATGEEIQRIINNESIFLKREVHSIVLDDNEFIASLASKELNVVKEVFENHIIVTGIEAFYHGVQQAQ